ncbi:MAG: AIR synthase-related protein, partial [Planctomycetota bacterium]|nr:AIR synthase-related protein [Planctomycetota bacterium]
GNILFLLGTTSEHFGGSHYLLVEGAESGTDVPPVNPAESRKVMEALQKTIAAGLVRTCHDLSEGGLAVAAAEMAFAGGLGVEINLSGGAGVPPEAKLFAENAGRFLVEVAQENERAFMEIVKDIPCSKLGCITDTGRIIFNAGGKTLIDVSIAEAKQAWQGTFDW